eukprot:403370574
MTTVANLRQSQNPAEDDLVSQQNEQLKQGKIKFLKTLQPEATNTFGKKNLDRGQEPSMKDIFSWGYEAPVKGDYLKDQTEIRYKIRKMDTEYISEVHDNYRKPEQTDEKGVYLFNYLDKDSQEKWKLKLYEMAVKNESDEVKRSTYNQLFCGQEKKWWEEILKQVTPAGKTSYKDKPKELITPEQFLKLKIEQKLKEVIMKNRALFPEKYATDENGNILSGRAAQQEGGNTVKVNVDPAEQAEKEAARMKRQQEKKILKRAQTAKSKRNLDKRLNEVKSTSRWLADSAITTYFGRPTFHPYGNGNTKPTVGGVISGDYLKSHNINPQSGDNKPEYRQVYGRAMLGATIEVRGPGQSPQKKTVRQPTLPRKVREDIRLTPGQVDEINNRNPIMPQRNTGEGMDHVHIDKPDLAKQKYLQSKHTTPMESQNQSVYEIQGNAQTQIKEQPLTIQQQFEQMRSQNLSNVSSHQVLPPQTLNYQIKQDANLEVYKNNATHLQGFDTQYLKDKTEEMTLKPQSKIYNATDYQTQQQEQKENVPISGQSLQNNQIPVHQHSQFCGHQTSQHNQDLPFAQQQLPFCPVHGAADQPEFLHMLDPKNYKFLPHHFTNVIRSAGKFTHKSENLGNLMSWKVDE